MSATGSTSARRAVSWLVAVGAILSLCLAIPRQVHRHRRLKEAYDRTVAVQAEIGEIQAKIQVVQREIVAGQEKIRQRSRQ